jgi:hypothetical protein
MDCLLYILFVLTKSHRFAQTTYLRVSYDSYKNQRLNLRTDIIFVPDYGGSHVGRRMKRSLTLNKYNCRCSLLLIYKQGLFDVIGEIRTESLTTKRLLK